MSVPIALVIGNRNYSSWSLRAWLAIRHTRLSFEEIFIPLNLPDTKAALERHSPSALVPVLKMGDQTVWESLAIIETLNDLAPEANLWPSDTNTRAHARAISSQMHAGFYRLRRDMPMDLRRDAPGQNHTEGALLDAAAITEIWSDCRQRADKSGPFLFGAWSAADMMYAPVAGRLRTYGVTTNDVCEDYMDAVFAQPDMAEWMLAARNEPYSIETP